MKLLRILSLCLFLTLASLILDTHATPSDDDDDDDWDYGEKGPETEAWCKVSAVCCNGTRQSPFFLNETSAQILQIQNITFEDYDKDIELIGRNNGKTVIFSLKPNSSIIPSIRGKGLDTYYLFQEIHFHWGNDISHGSEHTFWKSLAEENLFFEMEVQLVHYRKTYKRGYKIALGSGKKNALAILGVFYSSYLTNRSPFQKEDSTPGITTISESLPSIVSPGKTTTITLKLFHLLPAYLELGDKMYRYRGSLTSPPCSEIVIWNVIEKLATINEIELNEFRKLRSKGNTELSNNYRPINMEGNTEKKVVKPKRKYDTNITSNTEIAPIDTIEDFLKRYLEDQLFPNITFQK